MYTCNEHNTAGHILINLNLLKHIYYQIYTNNTCTGQNIAQPRTFKLNHIETFYNTCIPYMKKYIQ